MSKIHSPNPPASTTPNQTTAIRPAGGKCAAVPSGARSGPAVDDIRGSGSSVPAIGQREIGDGRCICGGGRATTTTTTGSGDGDIADAGEATEHGVVVGARIGK